MMPAGGNEGLAWCCPHLAVDLGSADARCLVDVVVAVDGLNYGFRIEIGVVDAWFVGAQFIVGGLGELDQALPEVVVVPAVFLSDCPSEWTVVVGIWGLCVFQGDLPDCFAVCAAQDVLFAFFQVCPGVLCVADFFVVEFGWFMAAVRFQDCAEGLELFRVEGEVTEVMVGVAHELVCELAVAFEGFICEFGI